MKKPIAALFTVLALGASACTDANQSAEPSATATGAVCEYPADSGGPAKPVDLPPTNDVATSGTTEATLHLNSGDITIKLDQEAAPCTVNSFLSLAQQGYFNDTTCHRLVDYGIFILQCGDPSGTGRGGPGYVFADELSGSESYDSGVVAMANRGANTNGSQFFFVWDDSELPPQYTVFGRVDEAGLNVVREIASQGVAEGTEKPIAEVRIESVTLG